MQLSKNKFNISHKNWLQLRPQYSFVGSLRITQQKQNFSAYLENCKRNESVSSDENRKVKRNILQ